MTYRTPKSRNALAPRQIASLALVPLLAGALSACEVRRDGSGGDPAPEPSETADAGDTSPNATPTPTDTASASIFREDLEPVVEEEAPADPLEITIPFPDGAEIDARVERQLASVLRSDAMDEEWPVILSGHTDSSGNDRANLRASRARAEAVAAWLVERGVEDSRIEVVAFGEQNPIAPNALPDGTPNEEGRRANRRVEVRIAPPASDAQEGESSNAEASTDE